MNCVINGGFYKGSKIFTSSKLVLFNGIDPDEIPWSAASHQGLHVFLLLFLCLFFFFFWGGGGGGVGALWLSGRILDTRLTEGVQWLSGRVLDSRPRGRGFEPHRHHCVVVLEQDTFILA